jgi:hypothetical protein
VPTRFWEELGGKLAEQWATRVLTPAFAFWAAGLAAWVWGRLGATIRHAGWRAALEGPTTALRALPVVLQVALIMAVAMGLAASAILAERLTVPLLELLQGDWPGGRPRRLRHWLVERHIGKRTAAYRRASQLTAERERPAGHPARAATEPRPAREQATERRLAREQAAELGAAEQRLHWLPADPAMVMPTRLGNVLRAAEARPAMKYGLDAVACWPHLWLLLGNDSREEIARARAALDAAIRLWLWGALTVVWTVWAWWALPLALVVTVASYYGSMVGAARAYGDLLDAAFDLNRGALYGALRWPLPASPAEESRQGEAISEYLWRGSDQPTPIFEPATDAQGRASSRGAAWLR